MSYFTANLTREEEEVRAELARQDAKFGPQNHLNGTGPERVWVYTGPAAYVADCARATTNDLIAAGGVTWSDILLEEIAEAFAEDDPERLEAELLQVEAVARQWRLAIRRRLAASEQGGEVFAR